MTISHPSRAAEQKRLKDSTIDLAVVFFLLLNHSGEEVSYMDILDMSNRSTEYTYTANQSLPKKCTFLNGILTELKLSFGAAHPYTPYNLARINWHAFLFTTNSASVKPFGVSSLFIFYFLC